MRKVAVARGGSIYIVTDTFAGAGDLVANGGKGGQTLLRGGGGGGGRIAVYYETSTFSGDALALGGFGKTESGVSGSGFDGTVGFFDTDGEDFIAGHDWRFQFDDQPFDFDTITIDNASFTTTEGTITITGTQLIVDSSSTFTVSDFDQLSILDVSVTGSSSIEGNLFLQANNLTIASGSKVSANSKGFKGGSGVGTGFPNQGQGGGGGGYGGEGGTNDGGIEYGSPTAPVDLGSGGAGPGFTPSGGAFVPSSGGPGGGKIQLTIADTLTVNGILSANGGMGLPQGSQSGGGSGGSIFAITEKFTGSGTITATGGNSQTTGGAAAGGGGAGGRIAIFHRQTETFSGTPTAIGGDGVGEDGENGTVVVSQTQLAISPEAGGDTGQVTAQISGSVFEDGATVKLAKSGESDIVGTVVSLENHGLTLTAAFDLTDKENGLWDLVVTQPNNDTLELEDGFEVEEGSSPDLWIDIVGRGAIRPNRPQTYFVVYGNNGNVDALGSDIFVGLPGSLEYKVNTDTSFRSAEDPTYVQLLDSRVPARSSAAFPLTIKTSATSGNADVSAAISTNSQSFGNDIEHFSSGSSSMLSKTVTPIDDPIPVLPANYSQLIILPQEDLVPDGYVIYTRMVDNAVSPGEFREVGMSMDGNVIFNYPDEGTIVRTLEEVRSGSIVVDGRTVQIDYRFAIRPESEANMLALAQQIKLNIALLDEYETVTFCPSDCQFPAASCIGYVAHLIYAQGSLVGNQFTYPWDVPFEGSFNIEDAIKRWTKDANDYELHLLDLLVNAPSVFTIWYNTVARVKPIAIGNPLDPNEKFGPMGVGEERYVSQRQSLDYSIFFENIESATAAAQEVIITDEIDDTYLDLDTFSLGPVGFGDRIIVPPSGLKEYITEIDLRPDNDLIVRLEAKLDSGSGVVTWRFTSLDPVTHAFTDDPEAGFLPPNDTHPEGEGFVLFSIHPKDDVSTADEIENEASIVFDTNSPITTNTWLNTIDDTKPSSSMNSMESTGTLTSFEISWSGSDAHSGIKEYTVYVSENSGPYTEEITTTGTFTSFVGVNGSTYSFYTRARDQVGNLEDAPGSPDETITINDPMQEPCTINTDYMVGVTCSGTTTVTNNTQLEDYLTDYDYNGTYYKNLTVNYNVTMDNIDIHSPCKVTISTGKVLTGERVCIDGRTGVENSNGMTVNGTLVTFVSETGNAALGSNSTVNATEMTLQASKTAEIGSSAQVDVDEQLLIKSIGNTSTSKATMGQNSTITAGSVRLESVREASTGPGMELDVDDELEIISTGTESSSKAVIGITSTITASILEMSADKQVEVSASTTVTLSEDASMTSTGSSSTSDVKLGSEGVITADSLEMVGGDDATLSTYAEVDVTGNFHMEANTVNDCSIHGTAVINAGTESGNCL